MDHRYILSIDIKLPNPVYIEFPPGLLEVGKITEEESKTKCIELSGGMYGSPESATQFFREYSKHLNKMDTSRAEWIHPFSTKETKKEEQLL